MRLATAAYAGDMIVNLCNSFLEVFCGASRVDDPVFKTAARTMQSVANKPTEEPASLIASIAYST